MRSFSKAIAIGRRLPPTRSPVAVNKAASKTMASGQLMEEEKSSTYNPRSYYPASIGETLGEKYQLISKLGWGTGSTVWLAKDISRWRWQPDSYVALKITNCSPDVRTAAHSELEISKHISQIHKAHQGKEYIRLVLDSFEIQGAGGKHLCLAFEPLRQPLWMLGRQVSANGFVPPRVIKVLMPNILRGLDFLHSECHVIHTDLKGDHFMLPFEDSAVLKQYVHEQNVNPAPFIERHDRPIYESRPNFGMMRKGVGFIKLTDFGLAVRGDVETKHNHDIQPLEYTAPEVLLKAGWTYSTDIWNLGLVLWELLAETSLLDGKRSGRSEYSHLTRFAQMIRLLGPPPAELLVRADKNVYSRLYNDEGQFKYPDLIPTEDFNFSNFTPILEGDEKRLFVAFARRMLKWMPEERATAKELLDDPWLKF